MERASVFVELTVEPYDLDAYYTTCAAGNDPSRRMIEKVIERYGGRHEDLLGAALTASRRDRDRPAPLYDPRRRGTRTLGDRETKQFAVGW